MIHPLSFTNFYSSPLKPEQKNIRIVLSPSGHVRWTWPRRILLTLSSKLSLVCSRVKGRSTVGVNTGLTVRFLKFSNASYSFVCIRVRSNTFCSGSNDNSSSTSWIVSSFKDTLLSLVLTWLYVSFSEWSISKRASFTGAKFGSSMWPFNCPTEWFPFGTWISGKGFCGVCRPFVLAPVSSYWEKMSFFAEPARLLRFWNGWQMLTNYVAKWTKLPAP